MKRFVCSSLWLFVVAFSVLHAHSVRFAPEGESLNLVCGCVNVVSGECVQQETDLSAFGLTHSRVYDSGNSEASSVIGYGFTWSLPRGILFYNSFKKRGKDDEGNFVDGGTTIASLENSDSAEVIIL